MLPYCTINNPDFSVTWDTVADVLGNFQKQSEIRGTTHSSLAMLMHCYSPDAEHPILFYRYDPNIPPSIFLQLEENGLPAFCARSALKSLVFVDKEQNRGSLATELKCLFFQHKKSQEMRLYCFAANKKLEKEELKGFEMPKAAVLKERGLPSLTGTINPVTALLDREKLSIIFDTELPTIHHNNLGTRVFGITLTDTQRLIKGMQEYIEQIGSTRISVIQRPLNAITIDNAQEAYQTACDAVMAYYSRMPHCDASILWKLHQSNENRIK